MPYPDPFDDPLDPIDDDTDDWFDWGTMRPYDDKAKSKTLKPSKPFVFASQWAAKKAQTKRDVQRDIQNRALKRAIERAKAPTKTYRARVGINGCSYYLGTYRTKEEADEAVFRFKIGLTP